MAYTDRFPIVKNFFETKLSVAADASDSRLILEDAGSLPAFLVGRDYIPIVLRDTGVVREIVYIVGIDVSNGAVDVVRAQEDTAAGNWREGTYVYCTVTADSLQRMRVNGFAPLVDGDLGRPEINVVSATAISMNGDYYSQVEAGMAVRVLTEDGVIEPVDASVGAIHVASVSYEDGVTVVGLQNVSLPSVIAGIDLGLSTAAAPMYHPDTVVADGVTTSQTGNVISALPMIGASATAKGLAGMVPAPAAGKDKKPLTGAGVFADVLDVNILGNAATATLATEAAALSAVNPVPMGGTGATTAEQARENLGITDLLEALDAAVVHKTGDETIAGTKTFTADMSLKEPTPVLKIIQTGMELGGNSIPTSVQSSRISFLDKNEKVQSTIYGEYSTFGNSLFGIQVYDPLLGGTSAMFQLIFTKEGQKYAVAPTTPSGSTGNQIVTADYLAKQGGIGGLAKDMGDADANTLLTPGFYYVRSKSTNFPTMSNYYVHVFSVYDKTQYIRQVCYRCGTIDSNDHNIWTRQIWISSDSTTFGDWIQMMTSKGGTMTGILRSSLENCAIASDADNKDIVIFGGSKYRKGGYLKLVGSDNIQRPGVAELVADDGTTITVFRVSPGGSATISNNPILTLVASWTDGNGNWYRKYSDGWIEQGGIAPVSAWAETVSFHTPFTQTPTVTFTARYESFGKNDDGGTHLDGLPTTTGFTHHSNGDARACDICWRACGY